MRLPGGNIRWVYAGCFLRFGKGVGGGRTVFYGGENAGDFCGEFCYNECKK